MGTFTRWTRKTAKTKIFKLKLLDLWNLEYWQYLNGLLLHIVQMRTMAQWWSCVVSMYGVKFFTWKTSRKWNFSCIIDVMVCWLSLLLCGHMVLDTTLSRVGGTHHICQGVSHENMTHNVTLLWPGDNWLLSYIKNISRSRHEMRHSVTGFIIWNVTRNWHEIRGGHGNVFKWLDCVRAQSIFWCCIIRFQYWRVRLCLGQRGIVRAGAHRSMFI